MNLEPTYTYMNVIEEAQKRYPPGTKIQEIPYDKQCKHSSAEEIYVVPENPKFIVGAHKFVYIELPEEQVRIRDIDGNWTEPITEAYYLIIREHEALVTVKKLAQEKGIPYIPINQTPNLLILQDGQIYESMFSLSSTNYKYISFLEFVQKVIELPPIEIKAGTIIEWKGEKYTLVRGRIYRVGEINICWSLLKDYVFIESHLFSSPTCSLKDLKSWLGEFKIINQ